MSDFMDGIRDEIRNRKDARLTVDNDAVLAVLTYVEMSHQITNPATFTVMVAGESKQLVIGWENPPPEEEGEE